MSRRAWIVLIVLALALFAMAVGGFLWPRPQFERGPWAGPDTASATAPPGSPR